MRPKPRITKYIGLSTDTKPSADYGDTFLEMDTGTICMFDGETWHAISRERKFSGDIVSFKARKVVPMQSVVVTMEPVQDLHGYDHPWPAGGGKNLIPYAPKDTDSKNGVTWTKNSDGSIAFSGTCSESVAMTFVEFMLPAGDYLLSNVGSTFAYTGGNRPIVYVRDLDNELSLAFIGFGQSANGVPFSLSATTNIRFYAVFQTDNVVSGVLYPMIRLASVTDSSYAPYENICPISGRTGADIEHTGFNVWDEEWEVGGLSTSDGQPNANPNAIRSKNFIPCLPNTAYYTKTVNIACYLWFYDGGKNFISFVTNNVNRAVTTPSNCRYMKLRAGDTVNPLQTYNHDISINYPSSDTAYHAYQGETLSVSWESEAGTVYGGTLDVVNGELVVDRAVVDMGTLNWWLYNHTTLGQYFFGDVSGLGVKRTGSYMNIAYPSICSAFKCVSRREDVFVNGTYCFDGDVVNVTQVQFKASAYSDAASFKTAMNGVQLVYELADPITYHLTPQEVRTLLGDNNVWSDAGPVTVKVKF